MRKVLVVLIFCILSFNAQAGIKSKLAMGAAGFIIEREIMPALATGVGTRVAIAAVNKLVANPVTKGVVISYLTYYIATSASNYVGKTASNIAQTSALADDPEFNQYLKTYHANYAAINAQLTAVADTLDKSKKTTCINSADVYSKKLPAYLYNMSDFHSPVQSGDYGSYEQLKTVEVVKDQLDHDHIPSAKAVEMYLLKRDGAAIAGRGMGRAYNNATALELPHIVHKTGATFRGANIPLAKVDSLNGFSMRAATIRDFAVYYIGAKLTNSQIAEFIKIYQRNQALCVYQ